MILSKLFEVCGVLVNHLVNGSSLSSRFWQTKTEAKGENPIKVPHH